MQEEEEIQSTDKPQQHQQMLHLTTAGANNQFYNLLLFLGDILTQPHHKERK